MDQKGQTIPVESVLTSSNYVWDVEDARKHLFVEVWNGPQPMNYHEPDTKDDWWEWVQHEPKLKEFNGEKCLVYQPTSDDIAKYHDGLDEIFQNNPNSLTMEELLQLDNDIVNRLNPEDLELQGMHYWIRLHEKRKAAKGKDVRPRISEAVNYGLGKSSNTPVIIPDNQSGDQEGELIDLKANG